MICVLNLKSSSGYQIRYLDNIPISALNYYICIFFSFLISKHKFWPIWQIPGFLLLP